MLWELGWVEESIGCWSMVPSAALAVGSLTALTGSGEVTTVSPSGLCLRFFPWDWR